ncbi:hypothetical protein TNCV_2131701 [Trichonephila clavipes]|nr:hypothetical protein TNCV_2131701 [Trichonephila clavipes]
MSACAGNHLRKQTLSNSCSLNRREQISSVILEPLLRNAWRAALESPKMTRPLACSRIGYTRAIGHGPRYSELWSSDELELEPPLLFTTPNQWHGIGFRHLPPPHSGSSVAPHDSPAFVLTFYWRDSTLYLNDDESIVAYIAYNTESDRKGFIELVVSLHRIICPRGRTTRCMEYAIPLLQGLFRTVSPYSAPDHPTVLEERVPIPQSKSVSAGECSPECRKASSQSIPHMFHWFLKEGRI